MAREREMPGSQRIDGAQPTLTRELLERYRAGDFEAERKLFERFRAELLDRARSHPRMRPIARQVTPDDVVQEVFWRVLSGGMLRDFDDRGRGSLQAALLTVLDCTLVDLGRRASARKRGGDSARVSIDEHADGAALSGSLASADTTPTSRAREHDLLDVARRILEPRELAVWLLVARDGLDSVEAGRRLGITDSAVRGLAKRARAKLIRALDRERPADETRSDG